MNILIVGIGGVGGYFGGLLAKFFEGNIAVKIMFLARGTHLKEIQKNGLKIIQGNETFIAKPSVATDNAAELGVADFILICTKSYDLESSIEQVKNNIHQDTIILPLLNGVDSRVRIKKILPNHLVLDGCVYIVARLKEAGIIENSGNIQKLFFGLDHFVNDKVFLLEKIFLQAGIEATFSQNISTIIWEKFIFISPTATATSYFDNCIGELLQDEKKLEKIKALIEEVKLLAGAMGIDFPKDITEKTLNKLRALPFDTTSSMHSDFQQKKQQTELESLTGYVVREGGKLGLEMRNYSEVYEGLKWREK